MMHVNETEAPCIELTFNVIEFQVLSNIDLHRRTKDVSILFHASYVPVAPRTTHIHIRNDMSRIRYLLLLLFIVKGLIFRNTYLKSFELN